MEPRTMEVLLALCEAAGEIVSSEQLLAQCWGSTSYSDSPVHKNIAQLRRILGDNAGAPLYIETIRKRGYRAVAPLDYFTASTTPDNWRDGSPFRGLLAFDETHAQVFFGRAEITRNLAAVVRSQVDNGLALTLLLGPSGSGKTSLVQAGLLPALSAARTDGAAAVLASTTFDLIDQGQQNLFTALAGALLDLEWDGQLALPGENAMSLGQRLAAGGETVSADLVAALAGQRSGLRFAVFIDRFEAMFNMAKISEAERNAFMHTLAQLARSPALILILACRNDFYPSIARDPLLIEAKRRGGHFDLDPPSFRDIVQIIRGPAAASKLSFGVDAQTQARLDDVLCQHAAASPDALPLLQYCLQQLYQLRTAQGELTFDAYQQLGGLEGAIGQRAEQLVLALTAAQRDSLPHIMAQVIVLSTDEENVSSQRAPWSALPSEAARQTVTALIDARLFVSDLVAGVPVFGIPHEAILRRWERMSEWIDTHRGALRARARLALHARRWQDEGRPGDLLLPSGKLLDEARLLQLSNGVPLTDNERDCIRLSARRARRHERLRVLVLTLIVALAMLASGLGLSEMAAKRAAELRRREAESLVDFMLGDFTDKLRPLGRLDFLESVSQRALQYLRGAQTEERSLAELMLRAKGLQVLGEVSRSRGDSAGAIDALNQANAILLRQQQATPNDIKVLKNLGVNAYWLGQMHRDRNDWQAAEQDWRAYLRFSDLLHALEPSNTEWWVEQSYAHNSLGSLALTRGMPALAVPEFEASIALKRRALAQMPASRTVTVELADSYSWLASAKQSLGQLEAAQQLYADEMMLARQLSERYPDESMWKRRLALAFQHRGLINLAKGRDADTLLDYELAIELYAAIVKQDRDNRGWQVELANLNQERLWLISRRAPATVILPQLAKTQQTLQSMAALDPKNVLWARRDAIARAHFSAVLLAAGMTGDAERQIDTALVTLAPMYEHNPSNLSSRLTLAEALLVYATLKNKQGDTAAAIQTCQKIYVMLDAGHMATMNYQILDLWVRANTCLGNRDAVQVATRRLNEIGYRDYAYLQFILNI
ncbi:AAA family ATPase [Rugamonas sp. FT29W]|uniref:AAA family ATPase n=2 Tax=Rugamonas aquatica TaxID=2743357 RepID=A0A6A7N956_9BURK|nr:AAA family ATPase [Rugamonas aquatica]